MRSISLIFVIIFSAALVVLAGCKPEEQGRPLRYQKGVYGGKADEKLTAEEIRQLRLRGETQRQ